jgi:hypothetical protein
VTTALLALQPAAASIGLLAVVGLLAHLAGDAGVVDLLASAVGLAILLLRVLAGALVLRHRVPLLVTRAGQALYTRPSGAIVACVPAD